MSIAPRLLHAIWLSAVTVIIGGCSDEGPASNACPQTYEFGNFGCARIQGVVRNAAGGALAARVSLSPAGETPNTFDSPTRDTDADGSYQLEIHNYGPTSITGSTDTVPMYVRAFVPSSGSPVGDSVLVEMMFVPVGEVPQVLEADITIN